MKETKTNTCQCPLSVADVQNLWRQSRRNQEDYGGKNFWNRWVLSLERKAELDYYY